MTTYSCFSYIGSTPVLLFLNNSAKQALFIHFLWEVFAILPSPVWCSTFQVNFKSIMRISEKFCLLQFRLCYCNFFPSWQVSDSCLETCFLWHAQSHLKAWEVNWLAPPAFNMLVFLFLSCCTGVYKLLLFPLEIHVTPVSNLHWFYLLISS